MAPTQLPLRTSGIRDNLSRGSVGDFLREKIQPGSSLSIVSAYFTIYAYAALKEELDSIEELRFLFGEPRFLKSLDPDKTDAQAFAIVDTGLKLSNQLQQKQVAKECAAWIEDKVQIRSIKQTSLLHGKLYHMTGSHGRNDAIVGSSNFTVRGLGLGARDTNNIELNLEVDSRRDRADLQRWFDELWHDEKLVEDVKAEVLLYLEKLYRDNTPQFIYYKTLFHIFERFLADQARGGLLDEDIRLTDTAIWQTLFEFQKDGVKGAINKILTHNGCIIADSVGLGKTYEALAIIKYFELMNQRVLVLCPKKLRENWTVYRAANNSPLNPFLQDRFDYTVLSHTDLSREKGMSGDVNLESFHWDNYNLVVIDESHNFRNNTRGQRDEEGNRIRKSRYERLMEDILQSGVKTKVLLLSATPVNNDLKDLRNQLYFMTEGEDDAFTHTLGISSLKDTLANAQRRFTEWARSSQRDTRKLLEALDSAFFKLLDELTIARSRKHIYTYYPDTIAELGGFPTRSTPLSIYADIDTKKRFLSYDRLNDEISNYRLSLFNPSAYVLPEFSHMYEIDEIAQFTQQKREHYLIGMMKVNFLKRLESSVHSFAITMNRTIAKIENLEVRIKQFRAFQESNPELDIEELQIEALEDEELQEALQVGKKLKFNFAHLDIDSWSTDLQEDKQQLNILAASAQFVTPEQDAKLAELKKLIRAKIENPTVNRDGLSNRKVLVFTAFADTAAYLFENLRDWAQQSLGIHIALVTGGSGADKTTLGRADFNHILTNFSPISKKRAKVANMPQDEAIDLLIATDCISEGQNLQDCDYLINYDIHWNPVRIIQRFGRIDRIGSRNETVQLVNFWPTPDLNKYIKLKNRVEARMALVDIAATAEDNLLRPEDVQDLIEDELKYRDKQLLRLKDEVLDLEDFTESVALNEFTLDDFRIELAKYIESNRRLLEDAPLGLYAVVPTDPTIPQIQPGVIYCLRQQGPGQDLETINPLQPYFLVYVQDDKNVRYSFAQPKQILDIYRLLCADRSRVQEALCNLFDQDTHNGQDLTHYNDLLLSAVKSIERTFKRRAIAQLQTSRSALLPTRQQQVSEQTDFELITWLVIK
ncbi:MAG: DEAD/DEAH box helicase family protein [Ardenticatenaceae bacterium]|nr:DEAD/DEAH box helicase family protein [Ardenticatenaceae bacterium]